MLVILIDHFLFQLLILLLLISANFLQSLKNSVQRFQSHLKSLILQHRIGLLITFQQ